MPRAVLLRHHLPDGSFHFDWMIQRTGGGGLVTFRTVVRIDRGLAHFAAERLDDHREAYLTYEGPVSGGRGTVTRVCEGELAIDSDSGDEFRASGRLGASHGRFEGRVRPDGAWEFSFTSEADPGGQPRVTR